MKPKNTIYVFLVLMLPLAIDLLVRILVGSSLAATPAISGIFAASYLQVLPFYIAYLILVLAILHLYNQHKSKTKSQRE